MTLKQILREEGEQMYRITEDLFKKVDADKLDWKPATGTNWMNTGQLLLHCATACGSMFKGYLANDWSPPEGIEYPEGAMTELLTADKLPSVNSLDQALKLLHDDHEIMKKHLGAVEEGELLSRSFAPPWGGPEMSLFQHLFMSIWHLGQHKGQLFYYLKLQGKDVDTHSLWGM